MNRVEKFREIRKYRRKMFSSFFLFFLLLATGICIVDYTVNSLIKDENCINIVSIQNRELYLEIALMNKKLQLDIRHIREDIEKIKDFFSR